MLRFVSGRFTRGVRAMALGLGVAALAPVSGAQWDFGNGGTDAPPSRFVESVFLGELSEEFVLNGVTGLGYFVNTIGNASTTALISPRHILGAAHYTNNIRNRDVWFFDADGGAHVRRVVSIETLKNGGRDSDIVIGTLDSPLPPEVEPVGVASRSIMNSMGFAFSREWSAGAVRLMRRFPTDADPKFVTWTSVQGVPTFTQAVNGDSGSPILAPVSNGGGARWCVVGTHSYRTIFSNIAWVADDLERFEGVQLVEPCTDLNADGRSDVMDLIAFLGGYSTGDSTADLDSNGTVDMMDLIEFLATFGPCE